MEIPTWIFIGPILKHQCFETSKFMIIPNILGKSMKHDPRWKSSHLEFFFSQPPTGPVWWWSILWPIHLAKNPPLDLIGMGAWPLPLVNVLRMEGIEGINIAHSSLGTLILVTFCNTTMNTTSKTVLFSSNPPLSVLATLKAPRNGPWTGELYVRVGGSPCLLWYLWPGVEANLSNLPFLENFPQATSFLRHKLESYSKKKNGDNTKNHTIISHWIHVWYIYLHLGVFYGKCC